MRLLLLAASLLCGCQQDTHHHPNARCAPATSSILKLTEAYYFIKQELPAGLNDLFSLFPGAKLLPELRKSNLRSSYRASTFGRKITVEGDYQGLPWVQPARNLILIKRGVDWDLPLACVNLKGDWVPVDEELAVAINLASYADLSAKSIGLLNLEDERKLGRTWLDSDTCPPNTRGAISWVKYGFSSRWIIKKPKCTLVLTTVRATYEFPFEFFDTKDYPEATFEHMKVIPTKRRGQRSSTASAGR